MRSNWEFGFLLTWMVGALLSLAFPVALIVIIIHFIHKFW